MRLLGGSARASVLALLCLVSCGDSTELRSSPVSSPPRISAPAATPTAASAPDTTSAATESTSLADTTASTTAESPATVFPTNPSVPDTTSATDPAEQYLGQTTEIYRRPLADGHDFVVRLSNESYADVFGYVWRAPTGSATTCLGDHAVFLGVPGEIGYSGSAWAVAPWFDHIDPPQAATVQPPSWQAPLPTADGTGDSAALPTQYVLIRTGDDASEVVLSAADGTELDRSPVTNRVAMIVVAPEAAGRSPEASALQVSVVGANGRASIPSPLISDARETPAECGPGEAPRQPLPPPGQQPNDPAAAQAQIRARYALLVDQTIPSDQKPPDLLDDNTGVQAAVTALHAGQYGEVAANASYSMDELVFTKPDEAWFRYTITTSIGTFSDRFGTAVFNGELWQTTRATICQDLAFAAAPCQPAPTAIEVPSSPEWEAALQEWMARANLYPGNDGCPPLSRC